MTLQYGFFNRLLLLSALATTSQAMTRYVGDLSDNVTQAISQYCGGSDQINFSKSRCSALMRCVLDNLPSDTTADNQSGNAIAALLPTVLALIAASPLELVQLAFLSPHRALATACFGIGLPAGLFRQLRATNTSLTDSKPNAPQTREWTFHLPTVRTTTTRKVWKDPFLTISIDLLILALSAVAIWFNYMVSSRVMVTWRCEYGWLVFIWPFICISWLLFSLSILWLMSESISVDLHFQDKVRTLSILQFMMLPYRSSSHVTQHYMELGKTKDAPGSTKTASPDTGSDPTASTASPSPVTASSVGNPDPEDRPKIVLAIAMPHETGIRSWRWYEATIETLAVGVYLYATFVFTSCQFLSGNTGLTFVSIMALCSSLVRILENIFWSPR